MGLILASQSPRRKEILTNLGLEFEIIPADVDESKVKDFSPSKLVKHLSYLKAKAVYDSHPEDVVLGSDTIVYMKGVYGKPHTKENAIKMIHSLNGKWHTVYTGVTIISKKGMESYYVKSQVKFKNMTDSEIASYVEECNPVDKAGAYGIQDSKIVEKYKGSLTNIIGLPEEGLVERIKELEK